MMNLKKLFVVGSMLVMAWTTANAELVNGVRQKPEPATTAWTVGTEEAPYYLYNTSVKLFFTQGNTWGTRGCVGPVASALKVYFSETSEGSGEYFLNDYVYISKDKKSYWKMACGEGGADAVYTDQGSSWGRSKWTIVPQSGNIFRIQTTTPLDAEDLTPKYMGRNDSIEQNYYNAYSEFTDDNKRFPVSVELTEDKTSHIDWALVSVADYEVVAAATVLYDKAEELMSYINSAKELGIEMSAETAIYENEASTVEEMNAAIEGIQNKIKAKQAGEATLDNPADMTASIVNPGFANSKTGWNGNDPAFGEGAAEFYEKNYDFYQTLKDMPNGVYGVSVQAFYRNGFSNVSYEEWQKKTPITAKVYAKSGEDSLNTALFNAWDFAQTGDQDALDALKADGRSWKNSAGEETASENGYIPNNMKAASYLFGLDANNYKQTAYVAVDNGELTFGLKKNDSNPGGNWTLFDNFTLSYFGTAPEAYQMALTKGMPAKTEYSTANVSKQYIDAYDAAYTLTATDKASFSAAIKAVADANDSIAKNTQLWVDLKDKYDAAYAATVEYDLYDAAWNLGDYLADGLDENAEQLIPMGVKAYTEAAAKEGDYALSNKEIEDIIAEIDSQLDILYKEVKEGLKPGTDVTKFLTNPGFEDGTNGWTISKKDGNVQLGGNDANHCFEAWHSTNFDVYQEVKDLPVGLYKLEVNGYVRYLDGGDDKKNNPAINNKAQSYELFEAGVPIYLYMNDSKTGLVNWFSYPKPKAFYDAIDKATYLYENDENAYPDNMIAASAAFADGGYLQETICMVSEPNTVTRIGVKGTPEAKFWPIFDNFKLTYLGNGVDIVKPQLEDMLTEAKKYESVVTTKTAKTALTNEIAAAEALLDGTDGDAMLAAIDKLQKAINDVTEAKSVCEKFAEFIEDYMQFANSIDATEALQLGSTILENLNACAYDADEIEAKKLELREMRLKVQLPADYAQTSADGKDLTAFIQTPNFSKIKDGVSVNAIDGWQNTSGYKFGNDDTQKSAFALEFYNTTFDMYQDITSVGEVVFPAGNYCLQMNAFERVNEASPAFLYAVAGKDTLAVVELMKHADGFNAEEGESGPGDMVSSVAMFEEGRYLNQIKFKFEGDTLRIGIKHEKNNGTDWVIMDNFKLYFYGDDNTGVETVNLIGKPAKVQYFTLDGRQVSAARKGLVIRKTTMDNGAVVVRKIQK